MSTEKSIIDYLNVLYKWKKFIFINLFIILVVTTVYSFLIPETFKATSKITLSNQQNNGLGGLGNLLSANNPVASIGSQILGISSPGQDLIMGLLNSRTLLTNVINKFDLMKYYEIEDNNMDKTLRAFQSDVSFNPTDNGLIEINVINKNPQKAAAISNYIVQITDSMNIQLNIEQARNNKDFIAKRYEKNVHDLKTAEDSMYRFQKKYGIYAVPEQLVSAFQAAGDLESELLKQEIAAEYAKGQYGEKSTQYISIDKQVNFIKNKINELKNSRSLSYPTNVLVPFERLPRMIENYFRYYREIEIQTKIMEFILPLYEQAKVDEQKSIPTLIVIDKAVPPQIKYAPKKALVILGISFIVLFFVILFVYRGESVINQAELKNELAVKENKFYQKIIKIYRLKL